MALAITALTAALLVALAVFVMAQGHGRFSLGVGAALLGYGALVAAIAWLGWKRHPLGYGPLVGVTLLHGCVVASTAWGSQAWWLWFGLLPALVAIVCLLAPVVREEFGRTGAR
ncbi:hypothetical protein [Aestuariimicrobium sp. Y1814]|uniref:hypothetical protein n=1 Tax=Aestuariimicrobium sp. Y1814 TaxID=3418742 RepID=UPI003DA7541C